MDKKELLEYIKSFSDDQYSNENRLKARIQLYDYCEHGNAWVEWVYDRFRFENIRTILELGCGNGVLWQKNISKVPAGLQIVLTDFSRGMVESAKNSIEDPLDRFQFQVADAEEIPYPDHSFDMIVANHLLYHFEGKDKLFSEISRVLAENGVVYASTVSSRNLRELIRLVHDFDNNLSFYNDTIKNFNMENGETILASHFNVAEKHLFQNDIIISSIEPLVLYLASHFTSEQFSILIKRFDELYEYLQSVLSENGRIRITNLNGLFCFKAL